jgi:putative DNA primase/helicase
VLNGLNRLLEQKRFSDCEASKKAVEQYKAESNSVQMFLNDNDYQNSATNYKLIKDLYLDYRIFCNEDGNVPFKKTNFIKQLRALGITVDRNMYGNVAFIQNQK